MKLLCAADLHLGRMPSRLPAGLGVPLAELGAAAAWRALVDRALEERADAVLLAGDVVDDRRDFFEAYADLRAGVARLAAAGVPVLAVSGNHDVDVLPRLADELDGLRLLGRGGRWEAVRLAGRGGVARVLGWSFPSERVTDSPLAGLREALAASGGAGPAIGLLHGDRDATASPYAPFAGRELREAGLDAWLLGHVHAPDPLEAGPPIGYLGSLAAADPGEEGTRGAWRLEVEGGAVALARLPLAPLRYETASVPTDGLAHPSEAAPAVLRALRELHARLAPAHGALRAVGVRLRFAGRSRLGEGLRRALAEEDPREGILDQDGIRYFVHDWRIEARPALDLARLAAGHDPLALAARTLLVLDGGDSPERRRLLADAAPRLGAVAERTAFAPLAPRPPDDEELARRLRDAALRLLETLAAQRGEAA